MTSLYRIVWRWHFYAGLIVLPVLAWLAVTGGLYLYKPEIERVVYREWLARPSSRAMLPTDRIIAVVEDATRARVNQIAIPTDRSESWRLTIEDGSGRHTAFVDPGTGQVLGVSAREGGVMKLDRDLHSLVITGPVGNALIEIVAGWAIILVLTGLYLWWPRSGMPALALRGAPPNRLFWRDLHASGGALVGAVILFLAVTGMPWSVFWGKQVQATVAAQGLGRPKAPGPQPWEHSAHDRAGLPWALQAASEPHAHGMGNVGADRILAIAASRGLGAPLTLTRPMAMGAPYIVAATVDRSEDAHVLYVEPATGRVLQDARHADFGAGAKAIEWGIAVHQGQEYGEANCLVMLAGCVGALLLSLTAPVLWWKRRFAPPPASDDPSRTRGVAVIMLAIGAFYPLTGATMVAALVGDKLWARYVRAAA
ncbi:PepSY-associated TM helix domain-containing protein [Sphingomonas tabacisoli]|uniref:PepSY-associated TM helix domain-containing protein n=1 Tax=Sphingomonas tabacisoli TaxID=2249466 RepID=A0ABW4I333_9SPHN